MVTCAVTPEQGRSGDERVRNSLLLTCQQSEVSLAIPDAVLPIPAERVGDSKCTSPSKPASVAVSKYYASDVYISAVVPTQEGGIHVEDTGCEDCQRCKASALSS